MNDVLPIDSYLIERPGPSCIKVGERYPTDKLLSSG